MRHVKAVPLSRRNLNAFIDRLNAAEPLDWPKFLYCAWTIVAIELKKPDVARETVIGAVTAAHACAVAYSNRTQANELSRVRGKVLSAAESLLKPIERRAPIRRELDKMARREFRTVTSIQTLLSTLLMAAPMSWGVSKKFRTIEG